MRFTLEQLGDEFEEITYFGDGDWDRVAAQELGWNFEAVGEELAGIKEYSTGVAWL